MWGFAPLPTCLQKYYNLVLLVKSGVKLSGVVSKTLKALTDKDAAILCFHNQNKKKADSHLGQLRQPYHRYGQAAVDRDFNSDFAVIPGGCTKKIQVVISGVIKLSIPLAPFPPVGRGGE